MVDEQDETEQPGPEVITQALELITSVRGSIRDCSQQLLVERYPQAPLPVVDFVSTLAETIKLEQRERNGEEVADDIIKGLVDRLYAAAGGFASWEDLDRLRVVAALLDLLVGFDLRWFGSSLVTQVPDIDLDGVEDSVRGEVVELVSVVVGFQIGQFLEEPDYDDDTLDLLEAAVALAQLRPDDEVLREATAEGIRHYATLQCWEILIPVREDEYEEAPLAKDLGEAVEELAELLDAPRFVLVSILLLTRDLLDSGAVSDSPSPRQIALLAFAVLHEEDNEEAFEDPDLLRWAELPAESLRSMVSAARSVVVEWAPEDDEAFSRQCRRWRIASMDPGSVPSRFVDFEQEPEAYSLEAARAVLPELEQQVWLMIHPGEVVRFFVDRFDLAEDQELDEEMLAEAFVLWRAGSPVVKDMLAQNPELEEQLSQL